MISVRLSSRLVVDKKLNVGLYSKAQVSSKIKLCMIITTIKFYAPISLLVTFDLCLGHRVSICTK